MFASWGFLLSCEEEKSKNKSYVERDVVLSENVCMMHPYTSWNQTKHLNPLMGHSK